MMRRFLYASLLAVAAISPAFAALRAWVDDPQVAPGDTVVLNLAHDGQTGTQPDLTPLRRDFDIVGRSTGSSLQIVNGRTSSTTQLSLTLAPKHAGQLTVPPIKWDSDISAALTLNVAAPGTQGNAQASPGNAGSKVFLETDVDPKSPYVQAAAHLTVRVFAAAPISHADLEFPSTNDALLRQTGTDSSSTVERNGQSYQVVTRHYLLFPQHSGALSLPGPTLSGEIADRRRQADPNDPFSAFFGGGSPFGGLFATTKPIRLHGEPIELHVQPRPAGAGGTYWLPARNVTLDARWQPTDLHARVGDPVTVTLHLQAEDLTAAQLPDLSGLWTLPPGLRAYPDEPTLKDTPRGDTIVSHREQNIALIADRAGQFALPELRVNWWDTRTNQLREVQLPARTLTVEPAAGGRTAAPAATATPQQLPAVPESAPTRSHSQGRFVLSPWVWISLALALLWLATLAAWLYSRRRRVPAVSKARPSQEPAGRAQSDPKAAFRAACRANDPRAARANLLLWANQSTSGPRISGLNALASRLHNPALTELLRSLDRACYAAGDWDGAALADVFSRQSLEDPAPSSKTRALAPLYR